MEQTLIHKNNELLTALLGKLTLVESNMDNLRALIQEKINPSKKEYLNDDDLDKMFGITQNIRYKMINDGLLRPRKLRGKNSKSLYLYSEILETIENGLISPKKKRHH